MSYTFNPIDLSQIQHPKLPLRLWAPIIVIGLLITFILTSIFSKVEILATTQGKVTPKGETKVVNSPISAVVKAVKVKNGAVTEKGDILFIFDLSYEELQLKGIKDKIGTVEEKLTNIGLLLDISEANLLQKLEQSKKENITATLVQRVHHQRLMVLFDEITNINEQILYLNADIKRQAFLNLRSVEELALQSELLAVNNQLHKKGFSSSIETKKLDYKRRELDFIVSAAKQGINIIKIKINMLKNEKQQVINSYLHENIRHYQELVELLRNYRVQERVLKNKLRHKEITSPYSGYIENLSITTTGNIVSQGEVLLKIVPVQDKKIIEIMIPNSEAGFVKKGNKVRIKFDAYTYTRYGTISGEITYLFKDSNKIDDNYIYKAYVEMEDEFLKIDSKKYNISNGMTAQVDIITGERSIFSYFTHPILNGINQSLKER